MTRQHFAHGPTDGPPNSPVDASTAAKMVSHEVGQGRTAASAVVISSPAIGDLGKRVIVLQDGTVVGTLGTGEIDLLIVEAVSGVWTHRPTQQTLNITVPVRGMPSETQRIHIEFHAPATELIIVGAGHIAGPLCQVGALLGFRVVVLDDRPEFARPERFPEATVVSIIDFSDPFASVTLGPLSHIVLVTRGHRYDYECLLRLLGHAPTPFYIGMIGSRRRVRATHEQLQQDGITPEQMKRVRAPVGLDLGGQTPAEIAISVMAEIVMLTHGGGGIPLTEKERVVERFFDKSVNTGPSHG